MEDRNLILQFLNTSTMFSHAGAEEKVLIGSKMKLLTSRDSGKHKVQVGAEHKPVLTSVSLYYPEAVLRVSTILPLPPTQAVSGPIQHALLKEGLTSDSVTWFVWLAASVTISRGNGTEILKEQSENKGVFCGYSQHMSLEAFTCPWRRKPRDFPQTGKAMKLSSALLKR